MTFYSELVQNAVNVVSVSAYIYDPEKETYDACTLGYFSPSLLPSLVESMNQWRVTDGGSPAEDRGDARGEYVITSTKRLEFWITVGGPKEESE